MKLLIVQLSQAFYYFSSLRSKYAPSTLPKHPQIYVLPLVLVTILQDMFRLLLVTGQDRKRRAEEINVPLTNSQQQGTL
jgi:hypothetical protein